MLKILKSKMDLSSIFLFLICLSPLFDTVNGVFRTMGVNIPITAPFRILTTLLGLFFIFKYSKKDFLITIASILVMSICALVHVFVFEMGLYQSMYNVVQWNYFVILFFALKGMLGYSKPKNEFEKWLNIFTMISLICFVVPFALGLGNYTYKSTKNGYKGFFISTNSVSFMYIGLYFVNIMLFLKRFNILNFIKVGLIALCLLLIGTKACLLFLLLGVLLIGIKFLKSSLPLSAKFITILAGLLLCGVVLFVYKDALMLSIKRIIGMYNKSENIWVFLSSSRFLRIPKYTYFFTKDNVIVKNLFGIGKALYPDLNIVEMDYFDLYFQFGILGFVQAIALQWYIFKQVFKLEKKSLFFIVLIVVYAFVVGHIFTNALSSTIAALTLSYMMIDKKKKIEYVIKEENYDLIQANV